MKTFQRRGSSTLTSFLGGPAFQVAIIGLRCSALACRTNWASFDAVTGMITESLQAIALGTNLKASINSTAERQLYPGGGTNFAILLASFANANVVLSSRYGPITLMPTGSPFGSVPIGIVVTCREGIVLYPPQNS
jgi:hypothetical protein